VLTEISGESVAADTAADRVLANDDLTRLAGIPHSDVLQLLLARLGDAATSVLARVLVRAD